MTKKEARQAKVNWNRAIDEGRVVKFYEGLRFAVYPTVEAAHLALADAKVAGICGGELLVSVKR